MLAALLFTNVGVTSAQSDWSVQNLGAPINTAAQEGFPTITESGLVLYFARRTVGAVDGGEIESWDIWVSERSGLDEQWREPRRLPDHINTIEGTEHSVSFSPDGHWLYFSSNALDTCGGLDIFRSYREDLSDELGWGEPQNLGCDVNTVASDVCVIYHVEELTGAVNLYFVSDREGTSGPMDVWRIGYDPDTDSFSTAEALTAVNSPAFDGHLDPISGYVWTSREGGYGRGDIWHSARDAQGNWLAPVNLGAGINTEFNEQLPSPFDHGRVIYFPSDRPGGSGGLDIYFATRTGRAQ